MPVQAFLDVNKSQTEIYNIQNRQRFCEIPNCGDGPVSNVVISSTGVVAYIYSRKMVLSNPK